MQETRPAAIEVRELTKRYGAVAAVRSASFNVTPGEIFGLLGRNGAGKTTLLECILGLRTRDAGHVAVEGIEADVEPLRVRTLLGAQLQGATLPDKITAREALSFFGSFYRQTVPVDELLESFQLGEKADARFVTLSGGQRQRLLLALAFVHRPRIVVLDEPSAGLDPEGRAELHAAIRRARDRGVTVLLSTHHLDEAERFCDRVAIIDAGRIVALGPPGELIAASGARSRLALRTGGPVDLFRWPAGEGVTAFRSRESTLIVECIDVGKALADTVAQLNALGVSVEDVRVERPTLEDAFRKATGAAWSQSP